MADYTLNPIKRAEIRATLRSYQLTQRMLKANRNALNMYVPRGAKQAAHERVAIGRYSIHLRDDARACRHIKLALAFLKGLEYHDAEWSCRPNHKPNPSRILTEIAHRAGTGVFGDANYHEQMTALRDWLSGAPSPGLLAKIWTQRCIALARQLGPGKVKIAVKETRPGKFVATARVGEEDVVAGWEEEGRSEALAALMALLTSAAEQARAAHGARKKAENLARKNGKVRVASSVAVTDEVSLALRPTEPPDVEEEPPTEPTRNTTAE